MPANSLIPSTVPETTSDEYLIEARAQFVKEKQQLALNQERVMEAFEEAARKARMGAELESNGVSDVLPNGAKVQVAVNAVEEQEKFMQQKFESERKRPEEQEAWEEATRRARTALERERRVTVDITYVVSTAVAPHSPHETAELQELSIQQSRDSVIEHGQREAAKGNPNVEEQACVKKRKVISLNCDAEGHRSPDCPEPKDWSRTKCSNCEEMGHPKLRCNNPPVVIEARNSSSDSLLLPTMAAQLPTSLENIQTYEERRKRVAC
jgi:hypothetical protein